MYFIDVQGTLISDTDKSPINGACELIRYLNSRALPYVIVTNNTKVTSNDFIADLRAKGLEIKDGAYIDPFCVLGEIIAPCAVAAFGASEFRQTIENLGYDINLDAPKAVLIASGTNFSFDDFAKINELVLSGAKLICMHETSIYKKNGRLYPGVGAIGAMIKASTGINNEVVGKPSANFYAHALNLLKKQSPSVEFTDITIISDDARGDLLGAKKLGMKTALVLSGKVSDPANSGVEHKIIDGIYADVSKFLESLQ